ncbi:S1 family peptidase [Pseudonocardia cypriaca]|uniref:Trypsin-like peptidase n=1 Tax=Pseudonocardia cypriaca TaxID=882449 RepID=A0A543G9V6_9PSEU|nr:serine protease [Pseudonocardia cypriaca]TQM42870.1 trypsin-like peptidase [Pseudonocardia cypriaca]
MDAEPGIDPHRVAEVIARGSDGGRRGSGYRVAPGVVLTAAHVVADARDVRVRFDADTDGEWSAPADEVVADPASDLAAVLIDPPDGAPTCAFGRIGEHPDELVVQAVGFPRFKLKNYERAGSYRDSHQAVGTVAPLSNRRSGRLEVTVRPPEQDPDPATSPWEGMSGAAVWAGRRIVGVVTDHHRSDGLNRLAATRITELLDAPAGDAVRPLRDLLALPTDLPDVTGSVRRPASYLLQVRDIAPERLLGREQELRELAGFAEQYGWWEGPPWAGKTALMAWFALHPPPAVEVVTFFVGTGRAGTSDGDAFLGAVTEQLAALAALARDTPATTVDRRRGLLALLDAAARRCRDARRRLLIVVDGIDEDTGPAAREPSIASLLPRHPPAGVAVLVTSRPGRSLPVDVPADHPLHHCDRRRLAVSPHAREVEHFARRELRERLREGPLHEDLIGLITASGGGLTRDDLAELTDTSPFAVADLLSGAFGRSVATRTRRAGGAERGYVLAHRTLREAAEHELGPRLDRYRTRLHVWCEDHQRRRWPPDTPAYLLHDHPRMLAVTGDAQRLTDLATDPLRHERLLEVTGGDAAALDEITLAQLVGARGGEPDLVAAVLLAVRREELTSRNRHVPVRLPAVWAALGRGERAAALARGLTKRSKRQAALAAAALTAAEAGHLDDAQALAERVPDRDRRDSVFAGMAASAVLHDSERAERWARGCTPQRRVVALAQVATGLAAKDLQRARAIVAELVPLAQDTRSRCAVVAAAVAVGELGWAEALVGGAVRGAARTRVSAELANALSAAGEVARAEEVAAGIRRPAARLPVLAAFVRDDVARGDDVAALRHLAQLQDAARSVANPGDALSELVTLVRAVSRDHAVAGGLLAEAEHLAVHGLREDRREWALARLAVAHAAVGATARSEELLDQVGDAHRLADALTEIAQLAVRRGDARRADAVVRRVPGTSRRMLAIADLAAAFAAAGDRARAAARAAEAEGMARRSTDPNRLLIMCDRVVDGLVAIDALPAAVEVAEQVSDPSARAAALRRVAGALAAYGAIDDAVALALALDEPERRSWALVAVCEAQAAAGRRDDAVSTAQAVLAEPSDDGYTRVVALLRLSTALHAVGATGDAERLRAAATEQVVGDVTDPGRRARAIAHLSIALAAAGDVEDAAVLFRRTQAELAGIAGEHGRDRARTRVVEAFAAAGRTEWAEEIGRAIAGPAARVRALSALATATGGDRGWTLLGRAEELIDAITSPEDRWAASGQLANAAAVLVAGDGPDRSRRSRIGRLVVELLGTDGWAEAIPAVARLHWEAFDALVDWLATRNAAGTDETLGHS